MPTNDPIKIKVNKFTESDFQAGIEKVKNLFPPDILQMVERVYRLETANFKSGQYQLTGTPGMEATIKIYPYGWGKRLKKFNIVPVGVVDMMDNPTKNTPKPSKKSFVALNDVSEGIKIIASYIQDKGAGSWYAGTNKKMGLEYEKTLMQISPLKYT